MADKLHETRIQLSVETVRVAILADQLMSRLPLSEMRKLEARVNRTSIRKNTADSVFEVFAMLGVAFMAEVREARLPQQQPQGGSGGEEA